MSRYINLAVYWKGMHEVLHNLFLPLYWKPIYTHGPNCCNGFIKIRRFHLSVRFARKRKDFIFQFNLKHHFTSLFAGKILYCPATWASFCLIHLEWIILFLFTSQNLAALFMSQKQLCSNNEGCVGSHQLSNYPAILRIQQQCIKNKSPLHLVLHLIYSRCKKPPTLATFSGI